MELCYFNFWKSTAEEHTMKGLDYRTGFTGEFNINRYGFILSAQIDLFGILIAGVGISNEAISIGFLNVILKFSYANHYLDSKYKTILKF